MSPSSSGHISRYRKLKLGTYINLNKLFAQKWIKMTILAPPDTNLGVVS